eukprot:XP_015571916.1 protein FANTASTIC FOUR 1 [Ricinus communis]
MGRTKAQASKSSKSKEIVVQEIPSQQTNIALRFDAPFPIFNALEGKSNTKGSLTHGHLITPIAHALPISPSSLLSMKCVRLVHFTKNAFLRGEVIDDAFHLKHAQDRTCWIKKNQEPHKVRIEEESEEEDDEEEDDEEEEESEEGKQGGSSNVVNELAI